VIPTRFTEDVRAGFQDAEPTGLPPHSTHCCRHGLAEPEPPVTGLAPRCAGLWVVRASIPTPRTNGAQDHVDPFHREVPELQALRANDDETNTCQEFTLGGITTGCLCYAPKGKLPAGVCLIIIDGVDGPTSTASKCQGVGAGGATMRETVHERVYQNRRRSGQAVYSDSCAGEQGRARGEAQVAALEISRIFRRCRALPHRHGGLRLGALLGAPASRDGSRRAADAAGLRQGL